MNPFTQYKPWMMERYGKALFRIPLQLAASCPHGRCAFCAESGAKAQQTQRQAGRREQIEAAIRFAKQRYRAKKFMLYVQAFTADLTDPEQQKQIVQSLEEFDFEAFTVGTRPDCLPDEALRFVETLKEKTEVWAEPGLQTAKDETLRRINRGHDWACGRRSVLALADRGIFVAPHVIIGLPGETEPDWNRTAEELSKLPISGIKIHNLHVVKGTALAERFAAEPFPVLNHWDYADALMEFLRQIPAEIPVLRISTDTPEEELIAPRWPIEKGPFLDYVIQQMTLREIRQGDLIQTASPAASFSAPPVLTEDGSITFFSPDWKEHYHTQKGARLEARKKFTEPSGLLQKMQTKDVHLLDVCFGLGNNSLAALCAAADPLCRPHTLNITALEIDKRAVRAAAEHFKGLETDPADWNRVLETLLDRGRAECGNSKIEICWGDARRLVQEAETEKFDIIFHDPFSSQRCPELWTVEFFQQLYRVMKPDGILLTYSSAQPVRGAMREAGFFIAETVPEHNMGNGTAAARNREVLKEFAPVAPPDQRRGIPYRDPHLCAPSKTILRARQELIEKIRPDS